MFASTEMLDGNQGVISTEPPEVPDRLVRGGATGVRAPVRWIHGFPRMAGANPKLRQVLDLAARVAPTPASVLICGETGTGKELVAQGIHASSPRAHEPLICVNCGTIPSGIAEAELFGYERGAFTGAVESRAGRFEAADRGTIFLDEIGELTPDLQVKLLRVLQEREVQRVGSHKVRKIDVRVIAATNRNLQEELRSGRFREDLYYRISTVELDLPSLRERSDDISMLATHLLDRACAEFGKSIAGFSPAALDALCRHPWPGNIRELRNVIERAVLLSDSDLISVDQLPGLFRNPSRVAFCGSLGATLRIEKRQRVEAALRQTNGNRTAAARLLGMSRSNFNRLVKSLNVSIPILVQTRPGPLDSHPIERPLLLQSA